MTTGKIHRMPYWNKKLAALLPALFLAACAQSPITPPPPSDGQPAPLTAFRAEGKLAWSHAGKGDSARFVWTYQEPQQRIDLLTPLGSVAATIKAQPGGVTLDTADSSLTARSLEDLTLRIFDMPLPLTGMEYWAQGLPVPGVPYTEETLPEGKRITQRGVVLDYPRWTTVNGRSLPEHVDVRDATVSLKLRIREWSLD